MIKDIQGKDFIDAMGSIDDDLIADVARLRQEYLSKGKDQKRSAKRAVITWIGSIAASVVILIAGGTFLLNSPMLRMGSAEKNFDSNCAAENSMETGGTAGSVAELTEEQAAKGEEAAEGEQAAEEPICQLTLEVKEVYPDRSCLLAAIEEVNRADEAYDFLAGELVFAAMETDWSMEYEAGDRIQVTFDAPEERTEEDGVRWMIYPDEKPMLQSEN